MQLSRVGLGLALALGIAAGCAAGNKGNTGAGSPGGNGGSGGNNGGAGGTFTTSTGMNTTSSTGTGDLNACATFKAAATQAPAAMLIVLDRSASMSTLNKWGTAGQAIVKAIDQPIFDSMSIGLTAFPQGPTSPPACLQGIFPQVFCSYYKAGQIPIPIQAAGTMLSTDAKGVRHDIFQFMNQNSPETDDDSDSSPIYDALNEAYTAIKGFNIDKRLVALITDGGFSCTSVSNPTRPGYSDGLCSDWEYPSSVNKLISDNYQDGATPINTFVIGVPGSNTHGENQGAYATAPYHMRLALSTYAVSGSPNTVDPTCDKSAIFSPTATDPAVPCHIDLSNSANFNPNTLADAIATVRGKALGCTYDLPKPPMGQTIDPGQVNVVVTISGTDYVIPKRKDSSDTCMVDPCWDYDSMGKVQLIGITCATVSTSATAQVTIYVGCATIIK